MLSARTRFSRIVPALLLGILSPLTSSAQTATAATVDDALVKRAEKIVAPIIQGNPAKAARVRDIVARQYADRRVIHDARDAVFKAGKEKAGADQAAADAAVKIARDAALARQAGLHYAFLGRLSAELTPAEIEQVKDGMTYGVLPLTYRVYQDMLPDLSAEQKAQIYAWLVEAREHAMDAGSSQEKHGWFGKYKGKINNYLAAAGCNMKQAERDLAARRKATVAAGK